MAKSLHELSPRAQLSVFVGLSALTVAAAWQVVIGPEQSQIATRQSRLTTLEAEVSKAQTVAAVLPAAQREVQALEAALRETEAIIPEEKDPQDVLRSLHQLASESLLDIEGFRPRAAVPKAQYTEWPIQLDLGGGYHDLGRFFDRIASMSRLISIADLQIRTRPNATGRGTVVASCVATTFVFRKDPALSHTGDRR